MKKIGAFEAKTHLSRLLDEVARGERFTITKHGVPVAVLAPVSKEHIRPVRDVIRDIYAFQREHELGDITLKELIEKGRA
jgi:prevent-host-death family protein